MSTVDSAREYQRLVRQDLRVSRCIIRLHG